MARPKVVVIWGRRSATQHWSPAAEQTLASFAERVDVHLDPSGSQDARDAALDAALPDADGIVICGWDAQGLGYLSAERLARAPRLCFIGATAHYRHAKFVDLNTALARGMALCETAPVMSPW